MEVYIDREHAEGILDGILSTEHRLQIALQGELYSNSLFAIERLFAEQREAFEPHYGAIRSVDSFVAKCNGEVSSNINAAATHYQNADLPNLWLANRMARAWLGVALALSPSAVDRVFLAQFLSLSEQHLKDECLRDVARKSGHLVGLEARHRVLYCTQLALERIGDPPAGNEWKHNKRFLTAFADLTYSMATQLFAEGLATGALGELRQKGSTDPATTSWSQELDFGSSFSNDVASVHDVR